MANNWQTIPIFLEQEIVTADKMNYLRSDINHLGGLVTGDGSTLLRELDTSSQIVIPTRAYQGWGAYFSTGQYPAIVGSMGSSGSATDYLNVGLMAEGSVIEAKIWYEPLGSLSSTTYSLQLYRCKTGETIGAKSSSSTVGMTGSAGKIYSKTITSLFSSVVADEFLNLRLKNNYQDTVVIKLIGVTVKF